MNNPEAPLNTAKQLAAFFILMWQKEKLTLSETEEKKVKKEHLTP